MSVLSIPEADGDDALDVEADLILCAMELAAEQSHGFTVEDLEQVEAYWSQLEPHVSAVGCVVSLTDGRRFHLLYVAGEEPEDEREDGLPDWILESVEVTQLTTTEAPPQPQTPPWIDDVAALNAWLCLPLVPDVRMPRLSMKR
ncbi:MAG: hypothetical protein JWQ58_3848 [Reyranella sp.]|nr:hypothetical protein [Reyranella sp.]